ncbi:hypothetical protein HK097_008282 [Rhizophlyctis rosea]|uniref:NADP-dependent oxidoreductase domain-containing protein n=1 Tax=Rhizophlyctis rosea TaxID=64517 RepID=A0AAD5SJI3_9FUNG|nr:hypothetical protein HK097_008282 [Rhizophlyctis rosea]
MQAPRMLYGTAWKKERTTSLVVQAVLAGFRGVDTACQPKHYEEPLVGEAVQILAREHNIPRSSLFLQTKFTSLDGQDPNRIPYDPHATLSNQVRQSFARSLENLKTDYIDSLVLHSPMRTHADTLTVWSTLEQFHAAQKVRYLGVSNIYNPQALKKLYQDAHVKPSVVQNRFYADTGYDQEIRAFCREHGITYQSFWTLTGNPECLRLSPVVQIARKRQATAEQVFFKFVLQLGITPLTGTSSEKHVAEDLQVLEWGDLSQDEVKSIAAAIGILN